MHSPAGNAMDTSVARHMASSSHNRPARYALSWVICSLLATLASSGHELEPRAREDTRTPGSPQRPGTPHAHTHTDTHTHKHKNTDTQAHTHTHKHTHKHEHKHEDTLLRRQASRDSLPELWSPETLAASHPAAIRRTRPGLRHNAGSEIARPGLPPSAAMRPGLRSRQEMQPGRRPRQAMQPGRRPRHAMQPGLRAGQALSAVLSQLRDASMTPGCLRRRSLQSDSSVAPPPPFAILAPNQTERPNPIQGMRIYQGGWNITSPNYWASLIWSGIPASLVALGWVVLLVVLLSSVLSVCLCCRKRWKRLRQRSEEPSRAVTIALIALGACGLALCIAGFVTLIVGQVSMWRHVTSDIDYIVATTTAVTDFARTVAELMQVAANASIGNIALPPSKAATLNFAAGQVVSTAEEADQQVLWAQTQVTGFIRTMSLIIIIVTSVFVVTIIVGFGLAFGKVFRLTIVVMCLVWLLCVFSLVMITVCVDAFNFTGDTEVALGQVEADPSAPSAIYSILPCTNQTVLKLTQVQVRAATYDLVNLVNFAWESGRLAPLQIGPYSVSSLCNPFQGPPEYLPSNASCRPSLEQIAKDINVTPCINDPSLCSSVQQTAQEAGFVVVTLAVILETLYPSIGPIVNCKYVADMAAAIVANSQEYNSAAYQAWAGYTILSVGAMVLAVLLPLYVFRATQAPVPSVEEDKDETLLQNGSEIHSSQHPTSEGGMPEPCLESPKKPLPA